MATWITLLRGVNLGGKNRLPMKEWAAGLATLGLKNPRTYIQSGNAVFESSRNDARRLASDIAAQVEAAHGFRPDVRVLTADRLQGLIDANPFPHGAADPKSLHLYFLAAAPEQANAAALESARAESERWAVHQDAFYLIAPAGIGRSKLPAGAEKWLGVSAMARNWRTVQQLRAISTAG